jgi:von Hippel-Lindau disease tumor supressor
VADEISAESGIIFYLMLKKTYFNFIIASSTLLPFTMSSDVFAANAQSQKCEAESVSISRTGKVTTEITFINQRSVPVKTYWLDYWGKRKFYAQIQPGDKVIQQTYVTHPWVITDVSNNCLGVYYPDGQPRIIEIL